MLGSKINVLKEIIRASKPFCRENQAGASTPDIPLAILLETVGNKEADLVWQVLCEHNGGRYPLPDTIYEMTEKAGLATRTALGAAFGDPEFGRYDEKEAKDLIRGVLSGNGDNIEYFSDEEIGRVENFLWSWKIAAEEILTSPRKSLPVLKAA